MSARVLFILKLGQSYGSYSRHISSGLFNSATFVAEMLEDVGIPAKVVQVVDNNDIDREVTKFRPTHVIIEALWVVPSKFMELIYHHPRVKWIVRIHSEMPFLALEGIAVGWLKGYVVFPQVSIAANSEEGYEELVDLVGTFKVEYLPNYYPVPVNVPARLPAGVVLDVGCFGAIRPLKNQLIQALAAMTYARKAGKILRFHVNVGRVEMGGEPILKNLRSLFAGTVHQLVEHPWMKREDFLELLGTMNVSMCVSLSETFCIVAADSVALGVPLMASSEVPWVTDGLALPTKVDDIVETLDTVLGWRHRSKKNLKSLAAYSKAARAEWIGALA